MLSYMYGNFITLTNISKDDLGKIIKYELEPLYVSVHSTKSNTRSIIFGNRNSTAGLDNLKVLDDNGIKTNIQIVLCPGINDGKELTDTLYVLLNDYNNIISIGIVPVGITRFNTDNSLRSCTGEDALNIIGFINDFKAGHRHAKDAEKVYLSDEFYILAQVGFPAYGSYGGFYQIKNGIGKSADFLKQIKDYIEKNSVSGMLCEKNILIVTSEYGKIVIENALKSNMENLSGTCKKNILPVRISEVKNEFFGGNIKTTGLLTGADIIARLNKENTDKYDKVIIPDSIFNEKNLTIDDYSKKDLKKICGKIKIVSEEGLSFIKELSS